MSTKRKIKGLILQPERPNCLFEGSLIFQNERFFQGRLSDRWGNSSIEGALAKTIELMCFRKKYDHKSGLILYSFRKEGDLWIGSYNGRFTDIGGAQCEIYDETPKIDWDKRQATERVSQELIEENERKLAKFLEESSAVLFAEMIRKFADIGYSDED